MDAANHDLCELFRQLGLPGTPEGVDAFIAQHRPLSAATVLPDAGFWSASQAAFLREALSADADWVVAVEHLDARLRA
ncbi:MAG: DUF2789 domain-containing protein [Pseudomonadota bacterium]|nr:DUF2789 domain-containing protein [Pseudomonadota bacterium]